MRVLVRPSTKRIESAWSFALSACLHGSVLAWVALAPLIPKAGPASLYEQEIRPHADRLVWYSLRDPLPDIAPSDRPFIHRPRAHTPSPKTLVAGVKDTGHPQMIWLPAPPLDKPQIVPSPNIVAFTPSRPVRRFTPLDQPHPKLLTPVLPEAPQLSASQEAAVPLPPLARPRPRAFTPPAEEHVQAFRPTLPTAPELTVASASQTVLQSALPRIQPARRSFIPPVEAKHAPILQPAALPDAPQVTAKSTAEAPLIPLTPAARAVRPFAIPEELRKPARPVDPLAASPEISAANRTPDVALAIVGLLPARPAEIPAPKASQEAGFSAGPQPQPAADLASATTRQIVVPGLLAETAPQDHQPSLLAGLEPPTSARNVMAAARAVRVTALASTMAVPGSLPVAAPQGSRLTGRLVYSVAIQMPNVTSYSGSWIIWFAERAPIPGQSPDIRPPLALRKVDPKYIPAAAAEKIEGKVRLAAVIRPDGHVEAVELLQHLDDRLDRSAQEALSQWEFAPATRNGAPVEVDAVFEIPFRLAPRSPR